jgi:class 3 adenylate cyclase
MDVGGWLRGLGLGQYETNFRDNKINADLLPRLTNDDLKDIGVSALGDRLQLLDAIAALVGAKPTPDASQSGPTPPKGLAVSAERRPITVMFCDLVGSTALSSSSSWAIGYSHILAFRAPMSRHQPKHNLRAIHAPTPIR